VYLSSRASAGNLSDVPQAQSFQIDSKFGPVACPEIGKSGTDCVFGDATLPLIFQVSPDDLDHVEFGVVGSQGEQECSIIDQPIFSSRDGDDSCPVVPRSAFRLRSVSTGISALSRSLTAVGT
jgi:hypothetical protein